MRSSRIGLILSAVAALAVSTVVVWDTAQADPAQPVSIKAAPVLDATQVGASITYLRSHYGVSQQEAMRRLTLQVQAEQMDDQLRKNLPNSYAGMWLDQDGGGLLRIASTDPNTLKSALAKVPDAAHISVTKVDRSLTELSAIADQVTSQLGVGNDQVSVDVQTNQVAVYQASGAAAAGKGVRTSKALEAAQNAVAKPDPRVSAVVAAHPGAVLRQMVLGQPKSALVTTPTACDPTTCPSPLRAGSRLVIKRTSANYDSDNENPNYGECTLGFVLYDVARRQYYALTAGHCLVAGDKTGVTHAYDSNLTEIGTEVTAYENAATSYPTDYALIAIPDYTHWFGANPKNQIDVWCTTDQSSNCTEASIPVTGVRSYSTATPPVGDIVCATGSGADDTYGYHSSTLAPGTRCGQVIDTDGGFKTDICSRKGDSGGPLFSEATGKAYGILSDGTDVTSPTPCGTQEWSDYSPVSKILTALNGQVLGHQGGIGQFVVRTAP